MSVNVTPGQPGSFEITEPDELVPGGRKTFCWLPSHFLGDRYELMGVGGPPAFPAVSPTSPTPTLIGKSETLGRGGTGVVVRAEELVRVLGVEEARLPRAVKFLRPTAARLLRSEMVTGSQGAYKHVVPLLAHGVAESSIGPLHYLVWPYIEGVTLDKFCIAWESPAWAPSVSRSLRRQRLLSDAVFGVLGDVADGLAELHDRKVAHIDLKPQNIIITPPPPSADVDEALAIRYRAFVTDLGASFSLKWKEGDSERMRPNITPEFFPHHLLRMLDHREDGTMSSAAVASHGVAIDLGCFAASLERLFLDRFDLDHKQWQEPQIAGAIHLGEGQRDQDFRKADFWSTVLDEDYLTLGAAASALRNGRCASAPDLKRLYLSPLPKAARHVRLAEGVVDRLPGRRIRVGESLIAVSRPYDEIVDHPVFQDLRRLHQLGLLDLVFPDATHTRFAHSLRTFGLAKEYLRRLSRQRAFCELFDRSSAEHVVAASLLHDLGQYPFSHGIEDLKKMADRAWGRVRAHEQNRHDFPSRYYDDDHETLSALTSIQHDQERFASRVRVKPSTGSRAIVDVLSDHGLDVDALVYMIGKRAREERRHAALNIGRDIVSGIIDVDCASYLLHDSARTGVGFGRGVEIDSLLEGITIRPEEPPGLAVEEGALSAVESLRAAVYWMYREVYWRHTNRGIMAAIKYVMTQLLTKSGGQFTFANYLDQARSEREALVILDSEHRTRFGESPLSGLVTGRRLGYRRAFSRGRLGPTRDRPRIPDDRFYDDLVSGISPHREDMLRRELERALRASPGEVLIDVPLKGRMGRRGVDTQLEGGRLTARLWVRLRRHLSRKPRAPEWSELKDASPLVEDLAWRELQHSKKVRVFLATRLLDKKSARELDEIEDRVEGVLKELVSGFPPAEFPTFEVPIRAE